MNGEHVVFAYSTRVASGSSQEKKKGSQESESHLDCIQNQMRNVSNTLILDETCPQRWKEEFFKNRPAIVLRNMRYSKLEISRRCHF